MQHIQFVLFFCLWPITAVYCFNAMFDEAVDGLKGGVALLFFFIWVCVSVLLW